MTLKLIGISPNVDPATGTASAELAPSGPDMDSLRPGLIGKITLKAGLHQGFLVPEDVVIQTQDKAYLRVVDAGVAKKIPVTLGAYLRGRIEIVQGLSEGMKVVERASGYVGDGDKVKVEESKEDAVN
jgi:multidrug efflux pump subunit AcrA (membrane-fusion protein)